MCICTSGVASSGRVLRKASSGAEGKLKKPPPVVTYLSAWPTAPSPRVSYNHKARGSFTRQTMRALM